MRLGYMFTVYSIISGAISIRKRGGNPGCVTVAVTLMARWKTHW